VGGSGCNPLVSVVITGYTLQRLPDILEALTSLIRQTYRDLEIIFVADGTEDLADRVEVFARDACANNLKIIRNDGPAGLTYARNVGIEHAQGEVIAFFDDDAVAAHDWAARLVQTFLAFPQGIGLTGHALPLWLGEEAAWFPDELDWLLGSTRFTGWHGLRVVRNAAGANMAFRREAFQHCRFSSTIVAGNQGDPTGIKRGLVGDDTLFSLEVCARTGRPIIFDPEVIVYHKVRPYRLLPEYIRRRAFWEGYTKAYLVRFSKGYLIRLSTEGDLLRRIMLGLFPRTLCQLITRPALAWKRLSLIVSVLFHTTLGYAAGRLGFANRALTHRYG
jgi:glycosyltransferase involved in cell wall biosynthesis